MRAARLPSAWLRCGLPGSRQPASPHHRQAVLSADFPPVSRTQLGDMGWFRRAKSVESRGVLPRPAGVNRYPPKRRWPMVWLAIFGGIVVASIAAAAWYDRRQRRRGVRVGVSRGDIEQQESLSPYSWALPGEGQRNPFRPPGSP